MNEKKFQELLDKLHIPTNRSYTDVYELLDAKLSEYLDRQDDASQALVEDIQDALDFAEKKKKEVGGGIALARDEESGTDSVDMNELRDASRKHADAENSIGTGNTVSDANVTRTSQTNTGRGATNSGKIWFYSLTGAQNIDNMFFQACDDLKYDQFDHADGIFELILQAEPNNASAYLGKTLVTFKFKDPKEIGSALDKPVDADINLRRAKDHATPAQKKYIEDALKERESAIKYKEAEKVAVYRDKIESQQEAAERFHQLGNYRDAKQRMEACNERMKELSYQKAVSVKNMNGISAQRTAIELFGKLGEYRDAKQQVEACKKRVKELAYEDAVRRKDKAKTSYDYRETKNIFASFQGYKDADKLYEVCKQREEELKLKEEKESSEKEKLVKIRNEYYRLKFEVSDCLSEVFDRYHEAKMKNENYRISDETKQKLEQLKKYIADTPELDEFFDREELKKEVDERMERLLEYDKKGRLIRFQYLIDQLAYYLYKIRIPAIVILLAMFVIWQYYCL